MAHHINISRRMTIRAFFGVLFFCIAVSPCMAQEQGWMIRIAKIEIDSNYISEYRYAIEEHTKAALTNEPGVLTLYAMYNRSQPTKVTVLEIYASNAAYQHHIKTPHFLKYKNGTLKMIKSLELIDVDPIAFGAKPDILKSFK